MPSPKAGTSDRLSRCAGCHRAFGRGHLPDLCCEFRSTGFPYQDGSEAWAIPCGSIYHSECFYAGAPFTTRLKDGKGLRFPSKGDPSLFPNFVCEACQVRAALERELTSRKGDVHLLGLERMRILDTFNRLAEGSMKTYLGPLRRIQRFEQSFGVRILRPTPLTGPSRSACIPLMWAQLDHTLQPGKEPGTTVKYSTSRQTRSAVSAYYQWDVAISRPSQVMSTGKGDKSIIAPHVLPTDELLYTQFSTGMRRRMGDVSKKSTALRFPQIRFLDAQFESSYLAATTPAGRHEAAAAGTANLIFWLGWVRSNEGFSLTWEDIEITPPLPAPSKASPSGLV